MSENLMLWLKAGGLLALMWVLGLAFHKFFLHRMEKYFRSTATQIDDLLLAATRFHLVFWFILLGLVLAVRIAPLPKAAAAAADKAAVALFVLSFSLALAKFISQWVSLYGSNRGLAASAMSWTQNTVKVAVLGIGLLIILSNLGIAITPALTALGVGSLAVALALQDTLSNLFAGFNIIATKSVQVGDYIQLDSGQEGYVEDIGWRASNIRQLAGNLIILPNSKLAQAVIVNYYRPRKDLAVLVQVGVSYASDLERVEQVVTQVGEEVMRAVPGGVPDFKPFIRYHTFGDSSVNFSVILRGAEFTDRFLITHEFIKRLHARFRREGIEIPFPQRDVHLRNSLPAEPDGGGRPERQGR